MNRGEEDLMVSMVLRVVREVERMQLSLTQPKGSPESTRIYVDRDVAEIVCGKAG